MIKNKKGFTLVELLAVIVLLGIILAIGVFTVNNIISKTKTDSIYQKIIMIVDNISLNEDGSCFYNYNFQENKDDIFKDLIIMKYNKDNVNKYMVYATDANGEVLIDASDFSSLNKKDYTSWIKENENSASYYVDTYVLEYGFNVCSNIYE